MIESFQGVPLVFRENEGVTNEDALETSLVHAEGKAADLSFAISCYPVADELGNASTQARSEAATCHHGNIDVLASERVFRRAHGGVKLVGYSLKMKSLVGCEDNDAWGESEQGVHVKRNRTAKAQSIRQRLQRSAQSVNDSRFQGF